jgi:DNA replication protein DnaC
MFEAEVKLVQFGAKPIDFTSRECPRCKKDREGKELEMQRVILASERAKTRRQWRVSCGIPDFFQTKVLENFDSKLQTEAYRAAKRYADGFPLDDARGYPSLILHSDVYGVGKTHLVVAVAHRIIDCWCGDPEGAICPVLFQTGPGLIVRVRATYNIRPDEVWHETEEEVYHSLRGVKLLIMDDVGKEKASDHTREVYFRIVDERYQRCLPVLITSNLPLQGLKTLMGEATVSRLAEMTGGQIIKMGGEDYRLSNQK